MKKLIFILCLVVFSFGCGTIDEIKNSMEYFKDTSTNTCFAKITMYVAGHWNVSITYVPCTPEVEKKIQGQH